MAGPGHVPNLAETLNLNSPLEFPQQTLTEFMQIEFRPRRNGREGAGLERGNGFLDVALFNFWKLLSSIFISKRKKLLKCFVRNCLNLYLVVRG